MSYDRKLEQVCTHQVVEEALLFNSDRISVRPQRPIAAAASVKVRFNGLSDVPSTGAQTSATVKGSAPGPFTIKAGVNDTLVFSMNGRPNQTIVAPSGTSLTAASLAKSLTAQVGGLLFTPTKRLQIQVITATRGQEAQIQFKTGSTLAATLGLSVNRVYRGQEIYPRWSLVNDPNTLSDRPTRFIVFDRALESLSDFVEVSYTTIRQECRRCGGVGIENDWRYDRAGATIRVRNAELLSQEVLKITYTAKGSNPFHPGYGTLFLDAIGKKLTDQGLVQNLILSDLQDAFRRWQSIKRQQEEDVGQFVSDEEYPFRLLVVNLEQDAVDPTVIFVHATVQNRSSSPIQITRGLKLPEPLDLMGSSAQNAFSRQNQARALGG